MGKGRKEYSSIQMTPGTKEAIRKKKRPKESYEDVIKRRFGL